MTLPSSLTRSNGSSGPDPDWSMPDDRSGRASSAIIAKMNAAQYRAYAMARGEWPEQYDPEEMTKAKQQMGVLTLELAHRQRTEKEK
jgi:hypothetical protein